MNTLERKLPIGIQTFEDIQPRKLSLCGQDVYFMANNKYGKALFS